jgi:hypothetical protein
VGTSSQNPEIAASGQIWPSNRYGTCRHCRQIAAVVRITSDLHEEVIADWPEVYTCHWLDGFELPPPVQRWNGGFEIRNGDCEICPHYEPAGGVIFPSSSTTAPGG